MAKSYKITREGEDSVVVVFNDNELLNDDLDAVVGRRLKKALWVMDNPGEPHCFFRSGG